MTLYDDIAVWYNDWVGEHSMGDDPYFAAAEPLLGDVSGLRILDLACGQGRVARHLAGKGALVTGVDLSRRLLDIARSREETEQRGIRYLHDDAHSLESLGDREFDGVLCHMALMDIPDLDSILRATARVLRPGGWFVFAMLHPCYHTSLSGESETPEGTVRTVGRYFTEGHWRSSTRTGPPGKVGAYHRTLSTYINALVDAGLAIERAVEPGPPEQIPDSPSLGSRPVWAEVPAVLIMRCRARGA